MSKLLLILRGLRFHWRGHAGVLAGVAVASAILTGALLMGDSVRLSLRGIALARLSGAHHALHQPNRFVDTELADLLGEETGAATAPLLHLRGMALRQDAGSGESTQVNRVQVLGVGPRFWPLAGVEGLELRPGEAAVNEKLAAALGLRTGDSLSLRITKPSLMALDAPLASGTQDRLARLRLTVKAILPDTGAGRFSLLTNQIAPYNAFVNIDRLQDIAALEGRANTILVGEGLTGPDLAAALRKRWTLEHAGLRLREYAHGIVQLESDRVFLDEAVADAALALPGATGTLAYLVNSIAKGEKSTPYSFAVAGPVAEDFEVDDAVINAWTAEQIGAHVGDSIQVAYYQLSPSNEFSEMTTTLKVREIRPMAAMAAEAGLVPSFPGLSDVESCADWDIGMPMDEQALADPANEAYWKEYRQTPKLLLSRQAGQTLWANRFGRYTAVRFMDGMDGMARMDDMDGEIREKIDPAAIGLGFVPVRARALEAVDQSMDFGGLFLGMSFFLIIAALVLTGLLFVFGVQQRSEELGALLVVGFRPGQVLRLVLAEAGLIALCASVGGALLGSVYARLLILGLSRFWEGAVAHMAIGYHGETSTIALGAAIAFLCALASISLAAWRQVRRPVARLLAADFSQEGVHRRSAGTRRVLPFLLPVAGVTLSCAGTVYVLSTRPANIALPFFGIGALLLLSELGFWRVVLLRLATKPAAAHLTLRKLAVQQIARRRGRSMAVAGLLACGVFLVLSVASMREDLAFHADERGSGTGGFELYAESTLPLQKDLASVLEPRGASAVALRLHDGDDASCLNLNYSPTPRLIGVNPGLMAELGAFDETGEVWELLDRTLPGGVMPALVGDSDTAMWGLQAATDPEKGAEFVYRDEAGEDVALRLMGCLPMRLSVFQGSLLISEENFTKLYPSESGYRTFLIDAPEGEGAGVAAELRRSFERSGMDVAPALERLREFYTVESTYLLIFLVLGGLGVALGGVGMGVVMLRNLLERRGELAMLGAVGYSPNSILRLLLHEHALLLLAGTGIGAAAAIVSIAPGLILTGTESPLALQAAMLGLVLLSGALCMGLALFAVRPSDNLSALRDE